MKTQTDSCVLTMDDVRVVLGARLLQAGAHHQIDNDAECDLCVRELRALACGLPWSVHPDGDGPTATDSICQGLNDAGWSSNEARTAACLPLALLSEDAAPVGWVGAVVEQTIRQIVPIALRATAAIHPDQADQAALMAAASVCEAWGTEDAARSASYAAAVSRAAADASAAAYTANSAYAAMFAAAYAIDCANSAGSAAAYAANAAGSAVADSANSARSAVAFTAVAAADSADSAGYATNYAAQDAVLALAVRITLVAHGRTDLL